METFGQLFSPTPGHTVGKGGGGGLCVPRQSVVVPIVGFDSDLVAGKVHVYQWDWSGQSIEYLLE